MDPGEALRRLFGFEHLRPGQAETVTAALAARDVCSPAVGAPESSKLCAA